MVHIFHFWPTSLVFEIVNPFSWIFNAISSDKSCLISTWRQDTRIFPACWILIGLFKFPARQPYASMRLMIWFELRIELWKVARILANKYILLTKREGRTGRISARGLDSTNRAQRGPYKKDRRLILSQYGPEQAWLIRDLLHVCRKQRL